MGEQYNQYVPSEENKPIVESLATEGVPQEIIASSLGICVETLQKYYGEELRKGSSEAGIEATKMLYRKVKEGDNASLFFYLKTKLGYRETAVVENRYTDTNGKDLHKQDLEIIKNARLKQD